MRQTKALLGMGAALTLLLLAGTAHGRSDAPTADAIDPSLAGTWHGTIHADASGFEGVDRRVMVEFREDGVFYCPTHDLVTLKSNSPSVGHMKREGDTLRLIMQVGTETHTRAFLPVLVPREERDARVPLKLYLHDVIEGVHLHLTPAAERSTP